MSGGVGEERFVREFMAKLSAPEKPQTHLYDLVLNYKASINTQKGLFRGL